MIRLLTTMFARVREALLGQDPGSSLYKDENCNRQNNYQKEEIER